MKLVIVNRIWKLENKDYVDIADPSKLDPKSTIGKVRKQFYLYYRVSNRAGNCWHQV